MSTGDAAEQCRNPSNTVPSRSHAHSLLCCLGRCAIGGRPARRTLPSERRRGSEAAANERGLSLAQTPDHPAPNPPSPPL